MGIDLASPLLLVLELIFVSLSLAALVFAVGLDATLDDLLFVLRRPRLLTTSILAVNVVVPISAIVVIALFPLSSPVNTGILLMAISPVPPTLPNDQRDVGATKSYAYGLYMALMAVSIVFVPAVVTAKGWIYGVGSPVPVPPFVLAIGLQVVFPLLLGLGVRRLLPKFAAKASAGVVKVSLLLLIAAELPVLVTTWPVMLSLLGDGTFLAMVLVVLIGLGSGHLLAGSDPAQRAALAIASANRHPGIATILAGSSLADERTLAAILLFLLTATGMTLLFRRWVRTSKHSNR